MHAKFEQIIDPFWQSGYEPFWDKRRAEVFVRMPIKNPSGHLTVSVCNPGARLPMVVRVSSNGLVASELPFVTFEAFEYMFLSLLQGCVFGGYSRRQTETPTPQGYDMELRFADEGPDTE